MKITELNIKARMAMTNKDKNIQAKGMKSLLKSADGLAEYGNSLYEGQVFGEEKQPINKEWKDKYKTCIKIQILVHTYAEFYLAKEIEVAKKLKSKIEKKAKKLAGHCYHSYAKAYIKTIIDRINVLTPDSVEPEVVEQA